MDISKHFVCKTAFLFTILLSSCNIGNRNVDSGYYLQNFDNLFYWNHSALVTTEMAHSGSYSAYVDSGQQFSQTFEMNLGYARHLGYKKFRVKAWCFKSTDDTHGSLSATVSRGDSTYAANGSDFAVVLKRSGSWGYCTFSLDLPVDAPGDAVIRVFLYTSNHTKAYLDDVEVIFKK